MNNKIIILGLVCFLGFVSHSSADEMREAIRSLAKCTFKNCKPQVDTARTLYKEQVDTCLAACGSTGKDIVLMADEELQKIKTCFKEKNCKLPFEHLIEKAKTPEVMALKACTDMKCMEETATAKRLGVPGVN